MGGASYPVDHLDRHWYKICARVGNWVYTLMDAIVENGGIGRKEAARIAGESGGDMGYIMASDMFSVGKRVRLTLHGRAVHTARILGISKQSLMVLSYVYVINKKVGFYIRSLYEIEVGYSIKVSDTAFRDSFSELSRKNLIRKTSRWEWITRDDGVVEEHARVLSAIFYKMCK